MSNKKIMMFLMTLVVLLVSVSAISAADVSADSGDDQVDDVASVITDNDTTSIDEASDDVSDNKNVKEQTTHIITNETFDDYFTDGYLNDNVQEGDTLDFDGNFFSSSEHNYTMIIDKPVNIVSSKNNTNISLNTTSTDFFGNDPGDAFTLNSGASGSNITNLSFYNSQILLRNVSNVVIDSISVTTYNQQLGSGIGVLSIRDNSSYVTVKNSYFYTYQNGGHSTLVLALANHCTIDNNTIYGSGNIGNIIYLTTYNVNNLTNYSSTNDYNNITNNKISVDDSAIASICYGIAICGNYNLIENNTVDYGGYAMTIQWGSGTSDESDTSSSIRTVGNTYRNNTITKGYVQVASYSNFYDNTVLDSWTKFNSNVNVSGNILYSVAASGVINITNNVVLTNITLTPSSNTTTSNISITENIINGNVVFNTSSQSTYSIRDMTIEDNIIAGNIAFANSTSTGGRSTVNSLLINNNIVSTIDLGSKRSHYAQNIVITNNNVTATDDYAVYLGTNAVNVTITNNTLKSAVYEGNNAINNSASNSSSITIGDNYPEVVDTVITVDDVTATYNSSSTLVATVVDNEGNLVNTGSVIFMIDGVTLTDDNNEVIEASVNNGVAQVSYDITNSVGTHNITASYLGGSYYVASESEVAKLVVEKRVANISITPISENLKSGQYITITVMVTDNGKIVDSGVVSFKFNDVTLKNDDGYTLNATVSNGLATVTYMIPVDMAAKTYKLTAVFSSGTYERVTTDYNITLIKSNVTTSSQPLIINKGENATVSMTLYDQNGNQLERSTKVTIKANGKTILQTNTVNGVLNATLDTSSFSNSYYNITIIFGENSCYNNLSINTCLIVNKDYNSTKV
ncbi:MAG: Ig-like domain-containing protein [Methanosphaera sp.]|nr:Ig-like domain-containing protein [Methanosphaera sp.]